MFFPPSTHCFSVGKNEDAGFAGAEVVFHRCLRRFGQKKSWRTLAAALQGHTGEVAMTGALV